jgi:predicted ATPase
MEVQIEGFKNINSISLDVKGITLLVGGNNSGKSSVLQAIQFGASVAQTSLLQAGLWRDGRLSTSIGQSDLVYSPIKDVLSLARNRRLRESEAEAIRITYRDGGNEARVSVRRGRNKNILLEIVGADLGKRLQSIPEPYCALVTGLAGIPAEEEFETNIVVRKTAAKGDSNSVFRNILLQLSEQQLKWDKFQQRIGRIFPGYEIGVSFNPNVDETISCTVQKSDGITYPIDTCGTGILQAVQIFSYIDLFSPRLLLLDEPDSHLHPNNQKQLAKELIDEAEAGLNVIVSTHSRHLVEALIDNASLVWLRGGVRQEQVEDYELNALLEIGALNAGEKIGNPSTIFLTEDKNRQMFEILLESNGYDLENCEVVSYSGCTQVGTAIALINHLRKGNPEAKYAIHRDRDFNNDEFLQTYKDRFDKIDVKVFISEGNDIESYFIRPEHIAEVCGIDVDLAKEVLNAAYSNRRNDLVEKYINSRIENEKKAGRQVNAGAIGVECEKEMTGPSSAAVHGKLLFKGVRDELRRLGIQDVLLGNSAVLSTDALRLLWGDRSTFS